MDEIKDISPKSVKFVLPAEFQPLVERAKAALQTIDAPTDERTGAQAVVVEAKDGRLYSSAVADWFTAPKDEDGLCPGERAIIEDLRAAGSPAVRLLCMWKIEDGAFNHLPLDQSSGDFRAALYALKEENGNARLPLIGWDRYITKTVWETLPPQR